MRGDPTTTPACGPWASTCSRSTTAVTARAAERPSEAGLYRDAEAAYGYLRDTLGVPPERIVLFGHSLGLGGGGGAGDAGAGRRTRAGRRADVRDRARPGGVPYVPVRWIARSRFASIERIGRVTMPKLFLHARPTR